MSSESRSGKRLQSLKEEMESNLPSEGGPSAESDTTKITVAINSTVARKAKAAVYLTPGLTLYELVEMGVQEMVHRIEEQRGEELPTDRKKLKGGRPLDM